MKTIKLLATSLLVAACTVFSSCGDDEVEIEPLDKGGTLEDIYSQHIDDYKNMTCKQFNENGNIIEFTGLTAKGYLMIKVFQKDTQTKVFDWVDNVKTDTIYKMYKGYGEYEEITVKSISLADDKSGIKSDKDFITLLHFYGETGKFTKVLFVNGEKSKMTAPLDYLYLETFIPNWYNDEYSFIHDCCYTSTGDTVYTIKYNPSDGNDIFYYMSSKTGIIYRNDTQHLSAEEVIIDGEIDDDSYRKVYNVNLSRLNLKQDKILWRKEVKLPFDYEAHARLSYSIVNKSTNIWEYKANITYYDGTKKDYTFYLNIEDGTISETLNASPIAG